MNSGKIYQKILVFFILPYPDQAFLGDNKWGSIISWWIGQLLGRAGFEPA